MKAVVDKIFNYYIYHFVIVVTQKLSLFYLFIEYPLHFDLKRDNDP